MGGDRYHRGCPPVAGGDPMGAGQADRGAKALVRQGGDAAEGTERGRHGHLDRSGL
ncbi:hypothetical protein [Micromonospora andamanensis]|uniref:hypothetical protein n=1 Tax=Micromonospora andamanensis TaxID=1287068 RepID=UPI00194E0C8B|nr:hypothetical protein [Micromonospora andamanensis]